MGGDDLFKLDKPTLVLLLKGLRLFSGILLLLFFFFLSGYWIQSNAAIDSSGDLINTFSVSGSMGDTINGVMATVVGGAAVLTTFLAFVVQYQANQAQRKDISTERFENQFYEMLRLHKENVNMDSEAKQLGLSDFEYAFYTTVADNYSAKDLMEKDKLRELAVILTERVKENASIDWTVKDSVRAKLKVIIKRTLRQYGYSPDMQNLATETVLKQAEMIAKELTV